jgi:hypothetical protein
MDKGDNEYRKFIVGDAKDTIFQVIISVVTGFVAFIAFCVGVQSEADINSDRE